MGINEVREALKAWDTIQKYDGPILPQMAWKGYPEVFKVEHTALVKLVKACRTLQAGNTAVEKELLSLVVNSNERIPATEYRNRRDRIPALAREILANAETGAPAAGSKHGRKLYKRQQDIAAYFGVDVRTIREAFKCGILSEVKRQNGVYHIPHAVLNRCRVKWPKNPKG